MPNLSSMRPASWLKLETEEAMSLRDMEDFLKHLASLFHL